MIGNNIKINKKIIASGTDLKIIYSNITLLTNATKQILEEYGKIYDILQVYENPKKEYRERDEKALNSLSKLGLMPSRSTLESYFNAIIFANSRIKYLNPNDRSNVGNILDNIESNIKQIGEVTDNINNSLLMIKVAHKKRNIKRYQELVTKYNIIENIKEEVNKLYEPTITIKKGVTEHGAIFYILKENLNLLNKTMYSYENIEVLPADIQYLQSLLYYTKKDTTYTPLSTFQLYEFSLGKDNRYITDRPMTFLDLYNIYGISKGKGEKTSIKGYKGTVITINGKSYSEDIIKAFTFNDKLLNEGFNINVETTTNKKYFSIYQSLIKNIAETIKINKDIFKEDILYILLHPEFLKAIKYDIMRNLDLSIKNEILINTYGDSIFVIKEMIENIKNINYADSISNLKDVYNSSNDTIYAQSTSLMVAEYIYAKTYNDILFFVSNILYFLNINIHYFNIFKLKEEYEDERIYHIIYDFLKAIGILDINLQNTEPNMKSLKINKTGIENIINMYIGLNIEALNKLLVRSNIMEQPIDNTTFYILEGIRNKVIMGIIDNNINNRDLINNFINSSINGVNNYFIIGYYESYNIIKESIFSFINHSYRTPGMNRKEAMVYREDEFYTLMVKVNSNEYIKKPRKGREPKEKKETEVGI